MAQLAIQFGKARASLRPSSVHGIHKRLLNGVSTATERDDFSLDAYDYSLPPELIAQTPAVPRDSSRLLVARIKREKQPVGVNDFPSIGDSVSHAAFRDLLNFLSPNDLLVMNDTKVIPARLFGRKIQSRHSSRSTDELLSGTAREELGARIEVLLLEEKAPLIWEALVKPGKRLRVGSSMSFDVSMKGENASPITASVVGIDEASGSRLLQFDGVDTESFWDFVDQAGQAPLPPYITSEASTP
mmetsp:Transcript_421/g.702  ORF Transcript_421/g.702 Transcript_421/m.702 type:complete len:244 (+) Transcript_421:69-800(+)